jgi:cytochrome c oxidase subunit 4
MSNHSSSSHIVSPWVYVGVFCALLAGTALTYFAATLDLGAFNLPVAILIACVKGSLVVLFFMHIYYSSKLTKTIVISGFCTLFILFFFTLIDLLSRGFIAGSHNWVGVPGR